jgi:hypothetical protein
MIPKEFKKEFCIQPNEQNFVMQTLYQISARVHKAMSDEVEAWQRKGKLK